jgi:hypothetical protein
MGKKIIDQFTNIKGSRQRKWQLRHPEAAKVIKHRYELTEKGREVQRRSSRKYGKSRREVLESRVYQREYQRDLNYWIRRYLNAKSYQDERSVYAT